MYYIISFAGKIFCIHVSKKKNQNINKTKQNKTNQNKNKNKNKTFYRGAYFD